MNPHPIIRKTIKWGGAVVAVLLVVVWIGGLWLTVTWTSSDLNTRIGLDGGALHVARSNVPMAGWKQLRSPPTPGVSIQQSGFAVNLLPSAVHFKTSWDVFVPVWVFALGTLVPAWFAGKAEAGSRGRSARTLCPRCNYDRTGLRGGAGAVCPECGAKRLDA